MKSIQIAVIAVAFAVAPVLSHASESAPIASTATVSTAANAGVSTLGAASAAPVSGMVTQMQAKAEAHARVLAMREQAREQYEHDAMWSH
jgi:hypothetical protein